MKFDDFYEEVILSLGGGLVDVELEPEHVQLAFKKAKRTFKQKGNDSYRRDFIRLPVDDCSMTYQIPSDVNTVVKIIKPNKWSYATADPFAQRAFNDMFGDYHKGNHSNYLTYELTLQMIETWKRYVDFDVQFHHNEFDSTISILHPASRKEVWLLEVYRDLSDEQYMDVLWIQSWAIAEAKIMLGTAYAKFPQLPGPDGSVSLDGSRLIQEGDREKEKLIEDIHSGVDGHSSAWEITLG